MQTKKTWDDIRAESFDPFKFNVVAIQSSESKQISVEKGCNAVQITNLGTCTVRINGITLFPSTTPATVAGDSTSFGGNLGELYKGELSLVMVLPLGAAPLVEIVQKFYIRFQ